MVYNYDIFETIMACRRNLRPISVFLSILIVKSVISDEVKSRSYLNPKVYRCGEQGQDLVVNFVNKNYPANDASSLDCRFRMLLKSPSICQIRVDFVDTDLMKPIQGECLSQQFEVEGAIWPTGLPPLCGKLDDQHFYVHLEQWNSNSSFVDFKVTTVVGGDKYRFGVWLTQIDCSSFNVLKAPEGCTQYFLSEKGTLKSFNFEGGRYLNGENYQICIRPGKNVCGVRYEAPTGSFGMKKSPKAPKGVIMRSGTGAICGMDYLLIPSGQQLTSEKTRFGRMIFQGPPQRRRPKPKRRRSTKRPNRRRNKRVRMKPTFDRFCGGKLSPRTGQVKSQPIYAPVRSNLITLLVRTSGLAQAQVVRQRFFGRAKNTTMGFKIFYQQLRECENTETDLATRPTVRNLLQIYNMERDHIPSLYRDELSQHDLERVKSIHEMPGSNSTLGKKFQNTTVDIPDEDKIWDYLDNENNAKAEDDELYDFLSG